MSATIALRRLGYRVAYRLLQLDWLVRRPELRGVKCVITDGGRLLFVRHTYGPRAWDLPGGSSRRGEPPLATAAREMEEELGLGSLPWRELGTLRGGLYRRRDTITIAGAPYDGRGLRVDPGEIDLVAWFPRHRLPRWLNPMVHPVLDNVLLDPPAGERTE